MSELIKLEIPATLTVNFSVSQCAFASLDGDHTETFDLSKLTSEDVTQYLAQTLIIKRQSAYRSKSAGNENGVTLVTGTWSVPAPGKRIAITAEGIKKTIDRAKNVVHLLTEQQKHDLAKSMGFSYVPAGLAQPDPELEEGEL